MATPNVVPRADQEGGLGTAAKSWGKLFIENPSDGGTAAATITNLDTDKHALAVYGSNITEDTAYIQSWTTTTSSALKISTSDTTSGFGMYIVHSGGGLLGTGRLLKTLNLDPSPSATAQVMNEFTYQTGGAFSGGTPYSKTNTKITNSLTNSGISGTVQTTGLYIEQGVLNNLSNTNLTTIGIRNRIVFGHEAKNIGYKSEITDGGLDLKFESSADSGDFFTVATGAKGATTITTVDDDGAAAHLNFDIDGNFLMDSSNGTTYWYLNGNTADYASFVIGADGDFTFTTVDAAAAAANLTFNIDGDFIINSTDFSVNGTGTITDGEWGGGIIGVEYGGTGAGSFTDNAVLTGTGTSAITAESNLTFTGSLLTLAGTQVINAGSSAGASALLINNDDADQIALDIDADNTTADIIDVVSSTLTTGSILKGSITNSSTALTNVHGFADFNWTKSGNTGDGESYVITGQSIEIIDISSSNHANSTVTQTGLDILIDSTNTNGTNTNTGIEIDVTDATTNYGLDITAEDGAGADIILRSSADDGDTFSIATGAAGATTLTTTDDDGATAHFKLDIDGDIRAWATSKQLYFGTQAGGGLDIMHLDCNSSTLKIASSSNLNDYLTIHVDTEGATTLTTVDADTAAAHFEVAADGNITLDAAGDVSIEASGGDLEVGDGSVNYFRFKLDATPELDIVGDFKLDGTGTVEIESGTTNDIRLDAGDDIDLYAEDSIHLVSEGNNALLDAVVFGKYEGANLVQRTAFGPGMHRLQFTIVFNLATTGTDNTVYYEVPLAKIPAYSHIVKANAVVEAQSTVSTFKANLSLSTTSGTSIGQAVAGTVQEIIGAGSSDTGSSDSAGSATDIALGAGGTPKKVWWMYGSGITVGSSDMYIYLLNAGTNNNGTPSRGHIHCTIDYYGMD